MSVPVTLSALLGVPAADTWAAVCAVDAAVYGEAAWSVCQPDVEKMLRSRGYALSVAWAGSSVVGFASAVCVTERCAVDVVASAYEERELGPDDVLESGPHPYWYVTSVCLLPVWTRRGLGTRLLASCLGLVAAACSELPHVTLVGQMWSDGGRATFARFGAIPVGPASMRLSCGPAELAAVAALFA